MKPGYLMKSLSLAIILILMMTTLSVGAFAAKPGTITPVTITTSDFSKTLADGDNIEIEIVAKYGTSKELIWEETSGHLSLVDVFDIYKKSVVVSEKAVYSFTNPGEGTYFESVTVTDGSSFSDKINVTFIVEGSSSANTPPVANDLSLTTNEDEPVSGTITASDPDGDSLTSSITSGPSNGIAIIATDMTVTYTPALNFSGTDAFVVTVSDGNNGTAAATVSITVNPVDDPPVATDDSASTMENTPVTIYVLENDTDIDGGEMYILDAFEATNGSVLINADQSVTFTPTQNFVGTGSFGYSLNKGSTALVTVTINGSVPEPLKYVALGDSIPYGYYYTSLWNYLFGGTDTDSYVEQLARALDVASVDFVDASVSGYNTVEVLNQIDTISADIADADIITLCVGANDIMDAASRGSSGLLKYDINWSLASTGRNNFELYWPQVIDKIENLNPDVTLVVMTLYNPYRLTDSFYTLVDPYFSASTGAALGLNYIIENTMLLDNSSWGNKLADTLDYRVADVYGAFNAHTNKDSLTGFYRSFCDPHPNQLGQNVIFEEHIKLFR